MGAPAPFELSHGGLDRAGLRRRLVDAGVELNTHAEWLLDRPVFDGVVPTRRASLDFATADELHPHGPACFGRLMTCAERAGYEPADLTCAPWLRLAMLDQAEAPDSILSSGRAPSGAIIVASKPVSDDHELPKGFYLRRVNGVPWLRGHRFTDEYLFPTETVFALERAATPSIADPVDCTTALS